jgi:dTDP-4-amino-4,6-dideoxygalactose transaminase
MQSFISLPRYASPAKSSETKHSLEARVFGSSPFGDQPLECDRRDAVRSRLLEAGIETGIHYPVPVHLQRVYSFPGHRPGDFAVAEEFSRRCLSLPIHPELTDVQIQSVASALREAVVK